GGFAAWTFHPAIPTSVIVGAVAITLTVRLVVFLVIGHEVIQSETVVASDKVYALLGFPLFVPVDLGTAEEPVGQPTCKTVFTPEETAHVIPEAAVPFFPTVADKMAYLVQAGRIP